VRDTRQAAGVDRLAQNGRGLRNADDRGVSTDPDRSSRSERRVPHDSPGQGRQMGQQGGVIPYTAQKLPSFRKQESSSVTVQMSPAPKLMMKSPGSMYPLRKETASSFSWMR